jgi:hypothetical protein
MSQVFWPMKLSIQLWIAHARPSTSTSTWPLFWECLEATMVVSSIHVTFKPLGCKKPRAITPSMVAHFDL